MRSEANSLDLNNLPEDYTRDGGKQTSGDSSSSAGGGGGCRKKKGSGGGKDEKDEADKVYECRFCSLKFCKSQALGGHMNRHRQERETETLNKARQLVFSNDLAPPPPHLGYVSSGQLQGGYHHHHHHQAAGSSNMDDAAAFRSMYPPAASRMFSPSSTLAPPQTVPSYAFPSPPPPPPPQLLNMPSQYAPAPPPNDYFLAPNSCYGAPPNGPNYYTCIGAPVTTTRPLDGGCGGDASDSSSLQQNPPEEGINWCRR